MRLLYEKKNQVNKPMLLYTVNKNFLPYKCEVEYLESTGTQYIDTGIIPTNDCVYDFKGECPEDVTGARVVFGSINTNNTASVNASLYNGGRNSRWGTSSIQNMYATALVPHVCQVSKDGYTVDGNNTAFESGSFTGTSTNSVVLFGYSAANGTVTTGSKIKLWYFKIKKNNILIRDFIPVLDWDMTPCMYDKVSSELFYNAGTGDFLYGSIIPISNKKYILRFIEGD